MEGKKAYSKEKSKEIFGAINQLFNRYNSYLDADRRGNGTDIHRYSKDIESAIKDYRERVPEELQSLFETLLENLANIPVIERNSNDLPDKEGQT